MIRTRLHFAILLMAMAAFGCVWAAGYRTFSLTAAGMATFGAAFLCTQFRTEPGVWTGGALLIVIALPQLAFGLMMTVGVPSAEKDPMPVIERVDYAIGTAILIGCYVFAIYATIVNFRMFPPQWSIKSGGEPSDAPQSRSRAF